MSRDEKVLVEPPVAGAVVPRLAVRGLEASYGSKQVLFGIDLDLQPGKVVTLLGHNGAGKTTILNCVLGLMRPRAGTVSVDGKPVLGLPTSRRVKDGMAFAPADNFVFPDLTVSENLALGGITAGSHAHRQERLEFVLERWPILRERSHQVAGTLSGGQRRMLSLAIALMSDPGLLLLDEPSLGLAPKVVDDLFADLRRLADETGMGILLVEQSVAKALTIADDVHVVQSGRVIVHESAAEFAARDSWWGLF